MYVQQFALENEGTEFLEFFFHVTNGEDYLNIDLSKTTHGEQEIAEIGFVDPRQSQVLPTFLATEPLAEKTQGPTIVFDSELIVSRQT